MLCEKCRYYDVDYEWDDEYDDEVEIDICKKGHDNKWELIENCSDYKRN